MATSQSQKWEALLRGSLLSSIMQKNIQYIARADARAQAMITISAFMIPIAMTGINNPEYRIAAVTCILTALCTIASAIWVLFPKNYQGKKHNHHNLLHFSQVAHIPEEEYVEKMHDATTNTGELTKMVVQDFYHLSKQVLTPKFTWLRVSYTIFLIGNLLTISIVLLSVGIL